MEQTLERNMAYFAIHGKPLREPVDIPGKWMGKLQCQPVDPEWKKRIKDHPWATSYEGCHPLDEEMALLRDKLLSFAGEEAVMPDMDEDIGDILAYGQLWNGWSNTRIKKGQPCHCHQNSADLYYANRDKENLTVATGYALSEDGLWRQHSWLVMRLARSVQVIETTKRRLLYFGVALTGKTLEDFLYWNR